MNDRFDINRIDRFYITGGTLPLDASSYITRRADQELRDGLRRGEFCYVLNTRQVGKSSLMVRVAQRLREEGVRVVVLDPTAIGLNVTVEEWYDGLLTIMAEQLSLRNELEDFWREHPRLGPMQRWLLALEQIALAHSAEPLCIFMDEIDSVQSLPFSTDEFFAGIRACYNRRAQDPAFQRLTFCLLGVATPVDLIADARTTPFNIGQRIPLTDFTREEAAPLAEGFGNRKEEEKKRREETSSGGLHSSAFAPLLDRILYWTGGHPYLTQRLCRALTQRNADPTVSDVDTVCGELFLSRQAQKMEDNLAFVRSRLLYEEADRAALLDVYRRVLDGQNIREDATSPLHSVLRLSGLVKVEEGGLAVRNRIYARVFNRQWVRDNMPGEELRRQRAAYRRGAARTASLSGVVVLAIGCLAGVALNQAKIARKAEQRATALQQITTQRLSRSYVDTGMRLLEQGDAGGALAPLVEAMALDQKDGERMALHRRRFAAALALAPRLEHVWFADKPLRCGAVSPDSHWVAAGGEDGQAHVWNVRTGEELPLAIHHDGAIGYAAFSPDGSRLVTCGNDRCAHVWDLKTRRLLCTLRHPQNEFGRNAVIHASWSHDGKRLATAYWNLVVVWDVSAAGASTAISAKKGAQADNGAKVILTGLAKHAGPNEAVFSPDGGRHATMFGSMTNAIIDIASKRPRFLIGNAVMGLFFDGEHGVFSADGKILIAIGSYGDHAQNLGAGVFDALVNSGVHGGRALLPLLRHEGLVYYAAFSPDEKRIVTASNDRTARVWDATNGRPLTPPLLHEDKVTHAEFSRDGSRIVTASDDRSARVWDTHTGLPLCAPLRHAGAVVTAQFCGAGNQVFTVSQDGTVRIWTLPQAQPPSVQIADTQCYARQLADPGKLLVDAVLHEEGTRDVERLYVLDTATGKRLYPSSSEKLVFTTASLSADARRIAFIGRNGNTPDAPEIAQVWDVVQSRPITPMFPANAACLSHNGRMLALPAKDNQACLVDVDTGQVRQRVYSALPSVTAHGLGFPSVFSPDDSRLMTCDQANNVRLIDTQTGGALPLSRPHDAVVREARFSPDGRYLFTVTDRAVMRVWNVAAGSLAAAPIPDRWPLEDYLCFTQDGHYAFMSDQASTIRWSLDGSAMLPARKINFRYQAPIVSPDSVLAVFPGQDDWLWETASLVSRTPTLDRGMKVIAAAFSPDSRRVLALRADGAARLWDTHTGAALTLLLIDDQQLMAAAFSQDGRIMATGGSNGSVRVWDAQTGEALGPHLQINGFVEHLEFTPDGRLIATSNAEGRVWELPNTSDSLARMTAYSLLLSGQRVDVNVGNLPANVSDLRAAWQRLHQTAQKTAAIR